MPSEPAAADAVEVERLLEVALSVTSPPGTLQAALPAVALVPASDVMYAWPSEPEAPAIRPTATAIELTSAWLWLVALIVTPVALLIAPPIPALVAPPTLACGKLSWMPTPRAPEPPSVVVLAWLLELAVNEIWPVE